jgi:hypothetical protein
VKVIEKPRLVAVSIQELNRGMFMPPYGFRQQGIIRGESAIPDASFTVEIGPLHPDNAIQCQQLEQHGFTVVELPSDWNHGYWNQQGDWREMVIRIAMEQITAIFEKNEGKVPMHGYDKELAHAVLVLLDESLPRSLTNMELKYALSPEPSDDALLTALEALQLQGLISGKGMHESTSSYRKLVVMANIQITGEGHKQLTGATQQIPPSNVFHGDPIFNYGQAGAIGRNAVGAINYQKQWEAIEQQVSLQALATQLEQLRVELQKTASSRDDIKQLGLVAEAEEHAEKNEGSKVLAVLSAIGKNLMPVATKLGADIVLKMIDHSYHVAS